jgi:hypothetical protein
MQHAERCLLVNNSITPNGLVEIVDEAESPSTLE